MAFVERQDIYTAQRIGDHESRALGLEQALVRRGPVAERFRPIRTPGNTWNSVIWVPELGIFSAVAGAGDTKRAMVSEDGETWTAYETPGANCAWASVAWSPQLGLLVAVASAGDAGERVMTSADGKSWALQTTISPSQDIPWRDVCWSPERGIFVAVANDTGTARVMTSADGSNWISKTTPAGWARGPSGSGITPTFDSAGVAWSSNLELFVAVASSALTTGIIYSSDAETWTFATIDNTTRPNLVWTGTQSLYRVRWFPHLNAFVTMGGNVYAWSGSTNVISSCLLRSTDGVSWEFVPLPTNKGTLRDFTWTGRESDTFVAIVSEPCNLTPQMRVMTAGSELVWQLQFTPQARNWRCIEWSPALNKLVILSADGPGYAGLVSP